jgi:hypothetical protein
MSAMEPRSVSNFVRQQGFDVEAGAACSGKASALMFQPRVVGATVLLGTMLQSSKVFAALGVLLWWSAALPKWNPLELLYNRIWGRRPGADRMGPAPAPRRFAQVLAGLFALWIALSLERGQDRTAFILEAVLLVSVALLLTVRFCVGSFLYHIIRGRAAFAVRTLPWGRPADERLD